MSLIVGALGIVNTMFVIVTEKIKDIGIMKSIGATNFQILYLFMTQAGLFGLLGAIVGVTFGSIVVFVFEKVAQSTGFGFLTVPIDFTVLFSMLIFGFLIGIFSGFLPARKASKLNVVEAIRKWLI